MCQCKILLLISFGALSLSMPLIEETNGTNNRGISQKNIQSQNLSKKTKQDEADGGEAGGEALGVLGGADGIADRISKIVNGAVSLNLGNIFTGSSSFIGGETEERVNGILSGVSKPINQLFGVASTRKPGTTAAASSKATTKKPASTASEDSDDDDDEEEGILITE